MNCYTCLLLALGGALGTMARYGVSLLALPLSKELPWGTGVDEVPRPPKKRTGALVPPFARICNGYGASSVPIDHSGCNDIADEGVAFETQRSQGARMQVIDHAAGYGKWLLMALSAGLWFAGNAWGVAKPKPTVRSGSLTETQAPTA